MSELRKQLRLILPTLSREANANTNKEIRRHLYLIKAVVDSPKSVVQTCEKRGVSTDQFYVWARRLVKAKNLTCLSSKSKKPRRSPAQTSKRVERKILALRIHEPSHGSERISFDLKKLFRIACAPSTVYNVLKRLKLISKNQSKRLVKRHHKRYRRPMPGYMQMDIKYVPYRIDGKQFYEFNIVDHSTTWRLCRQYRNINHENIVHFLGELESLCPFPIFEIQTDNGVEFTDKYRNGRVRPSGQHPLDLWCKQKEITHRLIPIGQKELNGKVENTHKQDDREFYAKDQAKSFEQLERRMRSYNERWNMLRATKALGWLTPDECVERAYVRAAACLIHMHRRFASKVIPTTLVKHTVYGDAYLEVPKPKRRPRKTTRPRRPGFVDRYLSWHDADQKKKLRGYLPLPFISQSFSATPLRHLVRSGFMPSLPGGFKKPPSGVDKFGV
jgi:transposase InsO family protein